jgi:hypothetical protein
VGFIGLGTKASRALAPLLVLALGVTGLLAAPAGAQGTYADANAHAVQVAIALTQANARIAELDRESVAAAARLAAAEATLLTATQALTTAQADLQVALDRLLGRAARSYQLGGAPMDPILNIDRLESLATVTQYADAAARVGNREVTSLRGEVLQRSAERDAAATEQQAASAHATELADERTALAARAQDLGATLADLGGVPISGASVLTPEQMTAFYLESGAHATLPAGTTIGDMTRMYVEEGTAERIRGDLAFAQSMLETGSFDETRGNNFSGIGNCDSCGGQGLVFASPQEGIRAQIQLLRSYADPDSRAANLANPPVPALFGMDPSSAAASYDGFFLKGKVPLWNDMGNGNWATSPTYAANVLGVYAKMLDFARTAG